MIMARWSHHRRQPRYNRLNPNGRRYQGGLRYDYATDTAKLMQAGQIVAIEFQTIAAANNYWRD